MKEEDTAGCSVTVQHMYLKAQVDLMYFFGLFEAGNLAVWLVFLTYSL